MTGTYEHSIDAKGRLFIPAKLREELGVTFYLAMGWTSVWPSTPGDLEPLYGKICLPAHEPVGRHAPLFANASKCELDSQGRIVIPRS